MRQSTAPAGCAARWCISIGSEVLIDWPVHDDVRQFCGDNFLRRSLSDDPARDAQTLKVQAGNAGADNPNVLQCALRFVSTLDAVRVINQLPVQSPERNLLTYCLPRG